MPSVNRKAQAHADYELLCMETLDRLIAEVVRESQDGTLLGITPRTRSALVEARQSLGLDVEQLRFRAGGGGDAA
jgi:hypothetical protein